MSDNEGPLSKISRMLGLSPLAPIAAVKRIKEHPVSMNAECMFKMAPTPNDMSDSGIHRLWEPDGPQIPTEVPIEALIRRRENARAFDLRYDYASYRPEGERWVCVDLNTYDGAEDSEAPCNFIGRGASEKEARMDLLGQFYDHDNPEPEPRQQPGMLVHSSPVEPATYIDNPGFRDDDEDVNFDDGLDDDPR